MAQFDDLLTGGTIDIDSKSKQDTPFDKEKWAEEKNRIREQVYAMAEQTAASFGSNTALFRQYLDVQSRFPRYSVNNALLITAQNPSATRLNDFDKWSEKQIRVKKGETGIYILKPGKEYERGDGNIGVSYEPSKVFDISQTYGKKSMASPQVISDRTRIKALMNKCPAKIVPLGDDQHTAITHYNPENNTIFVDRNLSTEDLFRHLSREIAFATLMRQDTAPDKRQYGFVAHSASYMLCKQNGIGTEVYDFDHVQERYSRLSPREIKDELGIIRETANQMSENMYKVFEHERKVKQQQGQER